MVKISAPLAEGKTADLDIVAVMDISGSMAGTKLQLMKEAMRLVIEKLSPDDRLSVITISSSVDLRHKKLTPMRPSEKDFLKKEVNNLNVGGGTNIRGGLQAGIEVLKERNKREADGRTACIFLMSDGEQNQGGDARTVIEIPDFTVHTFGFGARHEELVLSEIAYRSLSGVYSNVPDNKLNYLKEVMAAKLAIFRSVSVLDLKVTLTPTRAAPAIGARKVTTPAIGRQEVGSISVDAGDYVVTDGLAAGSRDISFGDLARHEIRRIIVDIPLPWHHHSDCECRASPQSRLPPHGVNVPETTVFAEVKLIRNETADQYAMEKDVKREMVRRGQAEYLRMVKSWTDKGDGYLNQAQREVARAREALDDHFEGTDNKLSDELYEELKNLSYLLVPKANADDYRKLCRAYLLACLSSHGRQRYGGRGGKEGEAPFYLTDRIKKYIDEVKGNRIP
ncbi:hypothetical protein PR202_ga30301 [Eleusine coracana subsp. coracana]|uniref:VWFA domain-containing protein n=1 Tax=Eleusine coracana subsp. coracana TaxID=191504 RepID=A0AAV5DPK5_ELECO|nr:hypothetical protein PR202_ga30301 [Eleusine coracana subsp. coracana]